MKKLKNIGILFILIISVVFIANQYVYAEKKTNIRLVKYSDEFERWVGLSNEEKLSTIEPKFHNDLNTSFESNNPIYNASIVGASVSPSFNLMNVIADNVEIRNQLDTNACWAFAGLSSLETNLALYNYRNNLGSKVYDFSEKHANYATTRFFKDDKVNLLGFNRVASTGGQWYLIENYLINGQGAISETDMPFDNNVDMIDISEVENKNVISHVYDTVYFDDYNALSGGERTTAMNKIKDHIQNYGSVFATIHGDFGDDTETCYDNESGAKYCNNKTSHPIDHAVSLIGWDDNYNKEKFPGSVKPKENGAWVVRNSWGEKTEYDLGEFRNEIFNQLKDIFIANGWNSPDAIPEEFFTAAGYEVSNGKIYIPVGDNGLMYISYEDCNVGGTLYGILSARDNRKDYTNIYQYNELYPGVQIDLDTNSTYLCNIFDRKSDIDEYLTEISLTTPETYTCKVFVNPDGDGIKKEDLQSVKLKAGETETIEVGYHTLEFENPIKLTGSKFAVIVEITGTRRNIDVVLEGKIDGLDTFNYATTETDKCFIGIDGDLSNCTWVDLGKLHNENIELTDGDSSIKAFTISIPEITDEPDDPENPDNDPDNAINSNFDNAKCNIKNIQRYTYTDSSSKNYTLIDTEINGIVKNSGNDAFEYSYYLSTNKNMESISDWVKITEDQTSNNKLAFKINSKDIKNYDEISKNASLYIYIREKAVKGDSESIYVTKAMNFETGNVAIETFVDNVKVQNNDGNTPENPNNDDNGNNGNNGRKWFFK